MKSQDFKKILQRARKKVADTPFASDGKRHDRVRSVERRDMRALFAFYEAGGLDAEEAIFRVTNDLSRDRATVKRYLSSVEETAPDQMTNEVGVSERDYGKLESILSQIWVPNPEEVPIRPLVHRDGLHEVEVRGQESLKWERNGTRVTRAWLDTNEESWLLEVFMPRLGEKSREELKAMWVSQQKRMCCYLSEAAAHISYVESGSGEPTIIEVESALLGGSLFNPHDPGAQRVSRLLEEAPQIRRDIAQFKKRILNEARKIVPKV